MTRRNLVALFIACGLTYPAGAQLVAAADVRAAGPKDAGTSSAAVVAASTTPATNPPQWQSRFSRWVDLNDFTFSGRYRSVTDSNGAHEFDQGQQRSILDGKFKFDREGRYGIVFHASSGRYFNWAYADFVGGGNHEAYLREELKMTPLQLGTFQYFQQLQPQRAVDSENSGGWTFYVRRLYLDMQPVDGLEVQYGGLDFNRGAGTEITSYDYDGYLSGERLLIKRPSVFYADEISATWAYIGDIYKPNLFARGERLGQSNYHQFLLRKAWHKRLDASADYTWQYGTQTLREAILFRVPEVRFAEEARVEGYQRLNNNFFPQTAFFVERSNGYALSFDKRVSKRAKLEYGYADIDYRYTVYTDAVIAADLSLTSNGDQYGVGKRLFVRPTISLKPYLSLSGYYTHSFDTTLSPLVQYWNEQALNVGFVFDIKRAIFGAGSVH